MHFLDTAKACHRDLLATLNDRSIKPSPRHSHALHALLGTLAFNFHGRTDEQRKAVLCSLSPGQAKTTALQTFIKHVSAHPNSITENGKKFSDVGILVCINTLDEIEAFCRELDPSNLCVWTGQQGEKEDLCRSLGDIQKPTDAQVLVTTHKRIEIELNDTKGEPSEFWSVSSLAYSKGTRIARVWDEAYLAGTPVVLPLRDLKRHQPYLEEVHTEAGEELRAIIKRADCLLDADQEATTWKFPAFWKQFDLDVGDIVKDIAATDRKLSDQLLEAIHDTFEALAYISGKPIVIRSDGNMIGSTILTYTPVIPDSFLPVIVLDASGAKGIRRTYDEMVRTGRLARLGPEAKKSYKGFKIDVWRKGGGKAQFIEQFDHRLAGIANWLTSEVPRGERVLVIHHLPDTPEQVRAKADRERRHKKYRPVMPDLSKALVDYLERNFPLYDTSNLAFTTWGKHRAKNDWKDYPNVVAAGTLFKPDSVYEATYRIARRYKPEHGKVDYETLETFKLGEYADDLMQGLGRCRIRQPFGTNSERCPPVRALVIAHPRSGIPDNLEVWFPKAEVRTVVLMPDDLDGTASAVLHFVEAWRKRSAIGSTLTFRDVKKSLGLTNEEFRDKCRESKTLTDRLKQLGIVEYKKEANSKYAQGWQLTSNVAHAQAQR